MHDGNLLTVKNIYILKKEKKTLEKISTQFTTNVVVFYTDVTRSDITGLNAKYKSMFIVHLFVEQVSNSRRVLHYCHLLAVMCTAGDLLFFFQPVKGQKPEPEPGRFLRDRPAGSSSTGATRLVSGTFPL